MEIQDTRAWCWHAGLVWWRALRLSGQDCYVNQASGHAQTVTLP